VGAINAETVAAAGNSTKDKIPRPHFRRLDDAHLRPRGMRDR